MIASGKNPRFGFLPMLLVATFLVLACSSETRHKTLKVFFDGVPDPAARDTEQERPLDPIEEEIARPAPSKPGPSSTVPSVVSRPALIWSADGAPLEALNSWEEVLRQLPTDESFGVDWVRAVEDGLISPKFVPVESNTREPPFSLETMSLVTAAFPTKPTLDLDLTLVPSERPFFEARFPHSAHTFWLNCSSCHPKAGEMRADMDRILAGEACGKCHGKVAFKPETECARCHENLRVPEPSIVDHDLELARQHPVEADSGSTLRGKGLYGEYCSFCHGETGDGKGRFAPWLDTQPRDFTTGKYKFRSTIGTAPPTDADIFATITRGVPGTSMPAWQALDYEDRWDIVHYIKTFSPRFEQEEPAEPLVIPEPPEVTEETLAYGKDLYGQAGCNSCHGETGDGNGPSAPSLKDDAGDSIRPFSFTSGRPMKSGWSPSDTYRIVMTGLPGTPMPGFGEVLEPRMAWGLATYVESLRDTERDPFAVRGDVVFERQEFPDDTPRLASTEIHELTPEQLAEDELFLLAGKDIPPATFPHWFHRIRFKCSSCHESRFKMEAGANPITMTAMRRGEFCASCHNGVVAWEVSFQTCVRCHEAR